MMLKQVTMSLLIAACGVANATQARFKVINSSSEPIERILVSPAYSREYGTTNLLGNAVLFSGKQVVVDPGLVPDSDNECLLDVIAIGTQGSRWKKRMDVCMGQDWQLTGGKESKKIM
jgi:hypothetical protein